MTRTLHTVSTATLSVHLTSCGLSKSGVTPGGGGAKPTRPWGSLLDVVMLPGCQEAIMRQSLLAVSCPRCDGNGRVLSMQMPRAKSTRVRRRKGKLARRKELGRRSTCTPGPYQVVGELKRSETDGKLHLNWHLRHEPWKR